MQSLFVLYTFVSLLMVCNGYIVEPGPSVKATRGEVWPKPQEQIKFDNFMIVKSSVFVFEISNYNCTILKEATYRYERIITRMGPWSRNSSYVMSSEDFAKFTDNKNFQGNLTVLKIQLNKPCEDLPKLNMDEQYELNVSSPSNPGEAILVSDSIWGILRGLETFSQLMYLHDDEKSLIINGTSIVDFPRFSHRGLLLDTSRHFMDMNILYKTLDAMAYNKLNVFHWHIVDDQSFPYESTTYPLLSKNGAYHRTMVYTQEDIKRIIDYATLLGIRVLPEFDTPGHTRSWGQGYIDLLTTCYEKGMPSGKYGPLNPIKNSTYDFMRNFIKEVIDVFPEEYIHLGADEVEFECWGSNPEINEFMHKHNITSYKDLEQSYIQNLIDMVSGLKARSVVWEEVFTNKINMPLETVVQVWIKPKTISAVTEAGFRALLSSCWYLDHLSNGGDWQKYYKCEPFDYVKTDSQKELIMGGEACMWAEAVDPTNVLSRMWPRASAVAERLWSGQNVTDIDNAKQRLEEHTCRMNIREIPAQPPNSAGFCVVNL